MTGNEALLTFALIAGGFLLGGVMFSRTLPKLLMGRDVCALRADKNPGAANVFAVCGVPMGLLCLALDMFKAYLLDKYGRITGNMRSIWSRVQRVFHAARRMNVQPTADQIVAMIERICDYVDNPRSASDCQTALRHYMRALYGHADRADR